MNALRAPGIVAAPPEGGGFAADWAMAAGPATSFLPRHPAQEDAWTARIAEVDRIPPARGLLARLRADATRLGADAAALASVDALLAGETLCVTTGQQPGLLVGPLFTLHKAWTAIELAGRLARRTGRRVVPLFWNAADDSDFAEIRTAILPAPSGRLARLSLEGGELPAGGMVGDLATAGTARSLAEAEPAIGGWPGWGALVALARGALDRASDHGELAAAWLYALTPGTGLVVVDGRSEELRHAGAPLFARYAARRDDVGKAVRAAGARLEAAGYRARITEASTWQALFDARDGRRLPFEGDDRALRTRIEHEPQTLSPNVVLRPLLTDSLLPSVATVAGPGEVAYHAQIAAAYARLEVGMPVLFPRFEATWVPRRVFELAARRGVAPIDLVRDFDGTMKRTADATLPAALREALAGLDARIGGLVSDVRRAAGDFEPDVTDAAAEMERRCRDAAGKMREKVAQAARAAEATRDPTLKHARELLRPRGIPQERTISALLAVLAGRPEGVEDAVRDHVEGAHESRPAHWLLPMGMPGEGA